MHQELLQKTTRGARKSAGKSWNLPSSCVNLKRPQRALGSLSLTSLLYSSSFPFSWVMEYGRWRMPYCPNICCWTSRNNDSECFIRSSNRSLLLILLAAGPANSSITPQQSPSSLHHHYGSISSIRHGRNGSFLHKTEAITSWWYLLLFRGLELSPVCYGRIQH